MSVPGVLPPVMAAVEEYRARSEHYARVRYLRERRALAATRVAVRAASGRHVLLGPTSDASARTFRHHVARFALTMLAERPSLLPLLAADYLRARPHRMWLELRHMLDDAIERKLTDVAAPTLIVRGEHDRIAPAAWVARLAALAPNAEVRTLPRWGHAINYSGAVELVPLVTEFLTRSLAQRATVAG